MFKVAEKYVNFELCLNKCSNMLHGPNQLNICIYFKDQKVSFFSSAASGLFPVSCHDSSQYPTTVFKTLCVHTTNCSLCLSSLQICTVAILSLTHIRNLQFPVPRLEKDGWC